MLVRGGTALECVRDEAGGVPPQRGDQTLGSKATLKKSSGQGSLEARIGIPPGQEERDQQDEVTPDSMSKKSEPGLF